MHGRSAAPTEITGCARDAARFAHHRNVKPAARAVFLRSPAGPWRDLQRRLARPTGRQRSGAAQRRSAFPLLHAAGHQPRIVLLPQLYIRKRGARCHCAEGWTLRPRNFPTVTRIPGCRTQRREIYEYHTVALGGRSRCAAVRHQHRCDNQRASNRQANAPGHQRS
jgi:hypothetical protein